MNDGKIQTGLRVPETLYERIQAHSANTGLSLNSQILMFVNIGITLADSGFILRGVELSESLHSPARNAQDSLE